MLRWEYALLVRRRQASTQDVGWEVTFTWYGPDGSMLDLTPYGDTALSHLNRAGDQGWEMVSMSEDGNQAGSSELHRYHLKRPKVAAPPRPRMRGTRTPRRPLVG